MDGQKLWNNILIGVKSQVTASSFKTWFAGSQVLDFQKKGEKDLLVVAVKNNFIKEQLEKKFSEMLCQIAKEKGFRGLELLFVVSNQPKEDSKVDKPLFTGVVPGYFANYKNSKTLNPNYTFENFVVGESNNLAYAAAKHIIDNLGAAYNPLLLWGPTGVGKSHLLQAIGNLALGQYENLQVVYVNSERFTNDYIDSLRNKTQAAFRRKYREVDLLLVDDIQFFSAKESTQDEFFYTFNELYLSQKQLVMATDQHPKDLSRVKERLISRFLGGMAVNIGLPDLEMKTAIIKVKCQNQNIMLNGEIVDYLVQNCDGGARELEGLLTSLFAHMKLAGSKLSIEDIMSIVGKQNSKLSLTITPQKIIKAVCGYFKIDPGLITSKSRKANLVSARQTLMYLLRRRSNLALDEIGDLLGGRDHSTVIYGVEKIEKSIISNQIKKDEILRIESLMFKNQ